MQTRIIAITNRLGLHARACARIVQIASRFRSNVSLVVGVKDEIEIIINYLFALRINLMNAATV